MMSRIDPLMKSVAKDAFKRLITSLYQFFGSHGGLLLGDHHTLNAVLRQPDICAS